LPVAARKPVRHAAEAGRSVPLTRLVAHLAMAVAVARHEMPVVPPAEMMRSRTVAAERHAVEHEASSMQATDAAKADAVKADAVEADAAKADGVKADAMKARAVKTDAVKTDAAKAQTVKTSAVKTSAVKATTASGRDFGLSNQSANQYRNRGDGSPANHLFAQSLAGRRRSVPMVRLYFLTREVQPRQLNTGRWLSRNPVRNPVIDRSRRRVPFKTHAFLRLVGSSRN
jgi:hypothetical protein